MCFDNLKELFHCADRCGLCTAIVACVPQKREHFASFSEGCLHLCNCGCCLLVALVVIALFFVYLFGIIAYFVVVSCVIFILILFAGWWLPWKLKPERKCSGHFWKGMQWIFCWWAINKPPSTCYDCCWCFDSETVRIGNYM